MKNIIVIQSFLGLLLVFHSAKNALPEHAQLAKYAKVFYQQNAIIVIKLQKVKPVLIKEDRDVRYVGLNRISNLKINYFNFCNDNCQIKFYNNS